MSFTFSAAVAAMTTSSTLHALALADILYLVIEELFRSHDTFRRVYIAGQPAKASTHGTVFRRLATVNKAFYEVATDVFISSYFVSRVDLYSQWDSRAGKYFCHVGLPPRSTWSRLRQTVCWLNPVAFDETVDRVGRQKLQEFLNGCPRLRHLTVDSWAMEKLSDASRIACTHLCLRMLSVTINERDFETVQDTLRLAHTVDHLRLELCAVPEHSTFIALGMVNLRKLEVVSQMPRSWQGFGSPLPELRAGVFERFLENRAVRPTSLRLGYHAAHGNAYTLTPLHFDATDRYNAALNCLLATLSPTLRDLRVTNGFLKRPPLPVPPCPEIRVLHLDCTQLDSTAPFLTFWNGLACAKVEHIRLDFDADHVYYALFIARRVMDDRPSLRRLELGGGILDRRGLGRMEAICLFRGIAFTLTPDALYPLDD